MNLRIADAKRGRVLLHPHGERRGRAQREQEPLALLESFMQRLVVQESQGILREMALAQLASGGRRMRARLALEAASKFRVGERAALAWAAAVEFLHNATLIHDDIQDEDRTRRGNPTLWVQFGVAPALNAGDFFLMMAYVALEDIEPAIRGELSVLLGRTSTRIVQGQTEELSLLEQGSFGWSSYERAARGKTGALFELPVAGAAILGGLSRDSLVQFAQVFGELGVVFQVQDDVVDLFGDKGRSERGSDIREGKVTALVVELLRLRPDLAPRVVELLGREREQTRDEDVEWFRDTCLTSGALEAVLERISKMVAFVERSELLRREVGAAALAKTLLDMSTGALHSIQRAALPRADAREVQRSEVELASLEISAMRGAEPALPLPRRRVAGRQS